jgi:AcrR family transcriptional regulator
MPDTSRQKPQGRRRKRSTLAETRKQLVRATLELLYRGGEPAVTTVSVTRAAGIVQSAFYRHFANVDECLAAAAEEVTTEIRAALAGARKQMYDERARVEDLEHFFRYLFDLAERQRPIMALFIRFRSDPLALNGVMYRFSRAIVSDLAELLATGAVKLGVRKPNLHRVGALALGLVGAWTSAIEAILDGRGPPLDESVRLLAAFSAGAAKAVYETRKPT